LDYEVAPAIAGAGIGTDANGSPSINLENQDNKSGTEFWEENASMLNIRLAADSERQRRKSTLGKTRPVLRYTN
jgi:hypothetical protein